MKSENIKTVLKKYGFLSVVEGEELVLEYGQWVSVTELRIRELYSVIYCTLWEDINGLGR